MAQTTLRIRMDENVKKQFDAFCLEAGMNTTVAINLYVKTVLREGKIPFEISVNCDPFYSDANKARIKKSIDDLNPKKGYEHELIGSEEE